MNSLAILGGPKSIPRPFPAYNSIGEAEIAAGRRVLESGMLSGFFGSPGPRFNGGPEVRALEAEWAEQFGVADAITFNSWTSGLIAAVGALDLEPGDEVITSPWTMCATATAILVWNAIPVFADIETLSFNLCPESVRSRITPRTRAILVPSIFGQAARLDELRALADEHGLILVEDAAQAPGATLNGQRVGTFGEIGGFSLNYHKHIHSGEGGVAVTNDSRLAERMRLIRNHGEAVVRPGSETSIRGILGFNFRLGEVEAAVTRPQLGRLPEIVRARRAAGSLISAGVEGLAGLRPAVVRKGADHVYYILAFTYSESETGITRDRIVEALAAEGVPWIYGGYQLIHLLPLYQHRIAYGSDGFPWSLSPDRSWPDYTRGVCPTAEAAHESVICLQIAQHDYDTTQCEQVIGAFRKVWGQLDELRSI